MCISGREEAEVTLFETKTKCQRNSTKQIVIALRYDMSVALKRCNMKLKKRRRNSRLFKATAMSNLRAVTLYLV